MWKPEAIQHFWHHQNGNKQQAVKIVICDVMSSVWRSWCHPVWSETWSTSVLTDWLFFPQLKLLFTGYQWFPSILEFPSLHSFGGLHHLFFCRTEEMTTTNCHFKDNLQEATQVTSAFYRPDPGTRLLTEERRHCCTHCCCSCCYSSDMWWQSAAGLSVWRTLAFQSQPRSLLAWYWDTAPWNEWCSPTIPVCHQAVCQCLISAASSPGKLLAMTGPLAHILKARPCGYFACCCV